ncbi:MAG TPA: phosphatase [Acidimicrobiia bacterium]|nr:phosphatase [Acidimicrobiia bacterium]
MTRRPRSGLPRHLPDPVPTARRPVRRVRALSAARRLRDAGVCGPHPRLGRGEVFAAARRLAGDASALHLAGDAVTAEEVRDAIAAAAGPFNGSRAAIDPDRVLAAATRAGTRLGAVADTGRRIAFATAQPASLLPLYGALARASRAAGATVLELDHSGPYTSGRSLWWHDDVAVAVGDGQLWAETHLAAGDEWLFAVGRPDLVVADGVFAVAAIGAGVETVAFADLDAPAPALAAHRGLPVEVVTVSGHRPPAAYHPVRDLILAGVTGPRPTQ